MTPHVVNVHSVPARAKVSGAAPERKAPAADRFGDRVAVVLVAAARRGVVPECFGFAVALVVVGRTVLGAELVVADDRSDHDPPACGALEEWAARQAIPTPNGTQPVRVVTRKEFCHPTEGLLLRRTYRGGGWLVTADEGRTLGVLAEWWGAARGRFSDGFLLGLPGCGTYTTWTTATGRTCSGWRARLHTPPLRVKALGDHGLMAEYGRAGRGGMTPSGEPAGHWEQGKPFLGRIVDLVGPAFALDGHDAATLSCHLGAFGLPTLDVPAAVTTTSRGADQLLAVARAAHQLAVALDEEAGRWLVGPEDADAGRASVELGALVSGGSLATRIWRRSGAVPPLAKFTTPDDEALDHYAAGSHGGWCTSELRGQVLPALDLDGRQAYPAAGCVARVHRLLFAEQLEEVDQLAEVRALSVAAAAGDAEPFFDQATYERCAMTRCMVLPQGDPWPVELEGRHGPRFYVRPVKSTQPMAAAFGDVMVASFLAGRAVKVCSATGLVPIGNDDVGPIPLRDGVVVPAGEDPLAALVRLRPPKGSDDRLRACIRGIANPAAWGVFARLDQRREKGTLVERYAAWSWPPIAACIPAVVRMWMAMVDRAVCDAGGAIICRDTDGLAVVSSPEGAKVELVDGRIVKVLSWADVESILRPFVALDPFGDDGHFWSVEKTDESGRPLHVLSLGPKRYTKLVLTEAGRFEVAGGTEHSLGGGVVDPPGWGERGADGLRHWVRVVHEHAVACAAGADPGWRARWDEGANDPFPVMRRYSASVPQVLAEVPAALGLHPFGPWIEAEPDKLVNDRVAIALDPGSDLADWKELRWFDRDGHRVRVCTVARHGMDVVLRTLDDYAYRWTQPATAEDDDLIEIDPRLIRRVGRGGALIDARLADPEARAGDHQVVYSGGDPSAVVAERARQMGKRAFGRLTALPATVAERAARGQPISADNVERALAALCSEPGVRRCALEGCEAPVPRPNARFCSKAHADRAYRARRSDRSQRRVSDPYAAIPTCAACGVLMLGGADTGTGLCIDCSEGGAS